MRYNPRVAYYNGPKVRSEHRDYAWMNQAVIGLTADQLREIMQYAMLDRKDTSASYQNKLGALITKITEWIDAGASHQFDRSKPGLYRGRGEEVTLVLDAYEEYRWNNIETSASLGIYSFDGKDSEGQSNDRRTPEMIRCHKLMKWADKYRDQPRLAMFSLKNKPISTLSIYDIDRRKKEILSERKFRRTMDEIIGRVRDPNKSPKTEAAESVSDMLGAVISTWEDKPVDAPRAKTVYTKPDQRPTGPAYDIPVPKVQIGQKLRTSYARSEDFRYYRSRHLRSMVKWLRPWKNKRFKKNEKRDYRLNINHKAMIRSSMAVIDNCYEIEVVSVIGRSHQLSGLYASNQCYIGGGSGFGGVNYTVSLVFRSEQPCSHREGTMNQLALIVDDCGNEQAVQRYVMEV